MPVAIATNPAIMARWTANGQSMEQVVTEACRRVNVPIYVQLHGPNVDHYLRELPRLSPWDDVGRIIDEVIIAAIDTNRPILVILTEAQSKSDRLF